MKDTFVCCVYSTATLSVVCTSVPVLRKFALHPVRYFFVFYVLCTVHYAVERRQLPRTGTQHFFTDAGKYDTVLTLTVSTPPPFPPA